MHTASEVPGWRAWGMAVRPQTLPAGISPVLVGMAVAIADDVFAPGPLLAALTGALLIQIGTNLANDYYDAQRGVDTEDRAGFTRVTQAGLIEPARVRTAMFATFAAAIVLGSYLVVVGGIPIVIIGLLSVVAGITYAGGPFPFGSYGLGDLFVFVFFGIIAVTGTYYVQAAAILAEPFPLWIPAETVTLDLVITSLSMAGLSTALLVVNNLRDIETDAAAGKRTLAVMIGRTYTRIEFVLMLVLAYLVPVTLVLRGWSPTVLLAWVSLPVAVLVTRMILQETDGERLNTALERTGQLLLLYAVLFTVGLIIA